MGKERFKAIVGVFAILKRDTQWLFLRRKQTGFMDGCYSFCAGHVEAGESVRAAMIRELFEEIGVRVNADQLRLVHTDSRNAEDGHRLHLFFEVTSWLGEPQNQEPEKCDDLRWLDPHMLPQNMVGYIPGVIQAIDQGIPYTEHGWLSTEFATSESDRGTDALG